MNRIMFYGFSCRKLLETKFLEAMRFVDGRLSLWMNAWTQIKLNFWSFKKHFISFKGTNRELSLNDSFENVIKWLENHNC